ncbi:MAG TPA: SpoIIE family protein phosphatase [Thermoanaerobaculaceae bacterium]|nr:SpoIIE family protein phosphatase [Thermoanaerobaculaceae bacterium]HPS76682.1 SpoIIE family protein phosphatase [Thermoanaerobaculaceae bacterium]
MASPPLLLTVHPAGGDSFERCLGEGPVTVGRSSRAGLPIADLMLSREHARLTSDQDGWWVEDLGSHNGTFLNGERLGARTRVGEGDVLSLGASRIAVRPAPHADGTERRLESEHSLFRPAAELLEERRTGPLLAEDEDVRRHVERLRLLNEVHQALGRPITQAELLELILDRAFAHLRPQEGAIYMRAVGGSFACVASRSTQGSSHAPFYSTNLVREVAEKGLAALVLDVAADERFAGAASILGAGVRSLVAAPLLDPEGSLGMIVLGSAARTRCFSPDDMELLVSLASAAALRIRNVALAEEAAERRHLASEMALARRIQEALFPDTLPEVPGWELHAVNRPSGVVSGDLYTAVLRGPESELAFMITDVAGKGVAASLLAASLEALCAGPIEAGFAADDTFVRVSARLYRRTPPEKYATAFLGILEPATGKVRYANAGHLPALVLTAHGAHRWLERTGLPLGLLPGATYPPAEVTLDPGNLLVLYTDGYTEAESPAGEELGKERFRDACAGLLGRPLPELAAALDSMLEDFTAAAPLSDDRTLLLLRRT